MSEQTNQKELQKLLSDYMSELDRAGGQINAIIKLIKKIHWNTPDFAQNLKLEYKEWIGNDHSFAQKMQHCNEELKISNNRLECIINSLEKTI